MPTREARFAVGHVAADGIPRRHEHASTICCAPKPEPKTDGAVLRMMDGARGADTERFSHCGHILRLSLIAPRRIPVVVPASIYRGRHATNFTRESIAGGGDRTHTAHSGHRILSPVGRFSRIIAIAPESAKTLGNLGLNSLFRASGKSR